MTIFDKRTSFKPFEYPEVIKFKEAIQHSYWLHSEWNFVSDLQDFNTRMSDIEKSALKNTLLAISQIEVSVKKFWGNLGDMFPKAEFEKVAAVFAESEERHESAYSHLLEILGFNSDFDQVLQVPEIKGRIEYLTKYLKGASDTNREKYTLTLALFSIFIENVSLFSQFAIIKSFNKNKNILKDLDNVIQATIKEEELHAQLGIYLINEIKKEFPKWFDSDFYERIYTAAKKAYIAEAKIIDWIFEKGELDYISKETLKEFTKDRFNKSVQSIGGEDVFKVDTECLKELKWFNEELLAQVNSDFFYKKPVTYSKKAQSIKEEDLF